MTKVKEVNVMPCQYNAETYLPTPSSGTALECHEAVCGTLLPYASHLRWPMRLSSFSALGNGSQFGISHHLWTSLVVKRARTTMQCQEKLADYTRTDVSHASTEITTASYVRALTFTLRLLSSWAGGPSCRWVISFGRIVLD